MRLLSHRWINLVIVSVASTVALIVGLCESDDEIVVEPSSWLGL